MGSTAVMNLMLGWLKGVANWILGLFDLAGTAAFSPLKWLSENWLSTLVVLLIAGIVIDVLVWLLRWRPHWVWFNKKRIVINDDDFFAGEELVDSGLYDPTLFAENAPAKRRTAPPPRRTAHFLLCFLPNKPCALRSFPGVCFCRKPCGRLDRALESILAGHCAVRSEGPGPV